MKILLSSVGTRGDIEPFLAQAELLQKDGHEVVCQFPEQFEKEVKALGYSFSAFDGGFLELLDSTSGKTIMGGGGSFWNQFKSYLNLIRSSSKIQKTILEEQRNALLAYIPDRIIFHPKCLYHLMAAMGEPGKFRLLSPIPCVTHPTEDFSHIGLAKWKPGSKAWNLRSYTFFNGMRYIAIRKYLKKFKGDIKPEHFKSNAIRKFETEELKTLYPISPNLFPKPSNWPENAIIPGFFQRNQQKNFIPDQELEAWLLRYPKAVLLTFGSMSNPNPEQSSKEIIRLLEKHQIPAVVNLSWRGLTKVQDSGDSIFYVNQIPYDWILPKMYGIIHHGGSGTTHQGALNACVQLIVPHIIDQYFWNRLISKKKLGPSGTSIHNFKSDKFEQALVEFWSHPEFKVKAEQIAKSMKNEANPEEVISWITSQKYK